MGEMLAQYYMVIKALHVIAVIAWMAGMLYLPRLFVYHCGAALDSAANELFKTMERRLLRYIMNPAMIATWLFGGLMIWANPSFFGEGWFHVKFAAVCAMTVVHHLYARWRKTFLADKNTRPAKFYKIWNEAPTVLMIIIVFMVITKPF